MKKPRRKSSRRDFLKGKAAADALGDVVDEIGASGTTDSAGTASACTPAERRREGLLLEVGRRAMACQFQVFAPMRDSAEDMEAILAALDCVDMWEDRLSVFRPQSEISRINRLAPETECVIEPETFELLERCLSYYETTGGAFDITAAPLVRVWGFHARQGRFPTDQELRDALARVGSHHVELNRATHGVRFAHPDMEINLGSVGKGFALDQCAQGLDAAGLNDYLIHGGHSSILARGSRSADGKARGWRVRLRHPLRPEQVLAELRLQDQALATSGSGRQFFYHKGHRYGHVIDPRSGYPADTVLSVTVVGPSGEQTDALATAFFVMGIEATRTLCRSMPELSVVFVRRGPRTGSVVLETIAMDDQSLAVADGVMVENGPSKNQTA